MASLQYRCCFLYYGALLGAVTQAWASASAQQRCTASRVRAGVVKTSEAAPGMASTQVFYFADVAQLGERNARTPGQEAMHSIASPGRGVKRI